MNTRPSMMIVPLSENSLQNLASMMHALWPDCTADEAFAEAQNMLSSENHQAFLAKAGSRDAGFVQLSLRSEFVEGTSTSPVAYVEGIFVHEAFRREGVGKKLIRHAIEWAVEQGCSEIASDAEMENEASIQFHKSAGFREANRIVCFVKELK